MSPATAHLKTLVGAPGRAREPSIPGFRIGAAAVVVLAAWDVSVGPSLQLAGLFSVGPCLAAASASWRAVVAMGGFSLAALAAVSRADAIWWTEQQLLYAIAIVAVTAVSALIAARRVAHEAEFSVARDQFAQGFAASTIGLALVRGGAPAAATPDLSINSALARLSGWHGDALPAALSDLLTDRGPEPVECEVRLEDGSVLLAVVTSTQLSTSPGESALRLVQVEDVTLERQAHQALTRLALHDQLTGLASRALLRDRLTHALERTLRSSHRVAVLYLDLDRFKHTNDSLGHEAGDRLLIEVASRLESAVRPEDTVARLGGDEFVVLLESVEGIGEAEVVAERLQSSLADPVVLDGERVYASASIGVAMSSDKATTPDALLRDADTAMYHAKGRGRARYELFDHSLRADAVALLLIESGLHQALDRGEFRVHLQPVVEPHTGRVVGAEALVRWQRPGFGLVQPAEFIPVAEDCGLIGRIDAWVLGEAVAQAARYRRERRDPDFYVSVNLSGAELADDRLPDMIGRTLAASGLPSDKLVVEVTESVYTDAVHSTLTSLQRLRSMNVRLALDDFGTGYSSLTYIKQYPFDILKVDRSFIKGMIVDRQDAGIVAGVLALARGLDLDAIAEGVESSALAGRLCTLGCPLGQGFTWSPPVVLAELIALPDVLVAV